VSIDTTSLSGCGLGVGVEEIVGLRLTEFAELADGAAGGVTDTLDDAVAADDPDEAPQPQATTPIRRKTDTRIMCR
jgi:hypothetical protein